MRLRTCHRCGWKNIEFLKLAPYLPSHKTILQKRNKSEVKPSYIHKIKSASEDITQFVIHHKIYYNIKHQYKLKTRHIN